MSVKRLRECLGRVDLRDVVCTVTGIGYRFDYMRATKPAAKAA